VQAEKQADEIRLKAVFDTLNGDELVLNAK
jgi:hypothetical protein